MTTRFDGRKPDALRPITIERGYTKHAPGSVLVSFGDTRVLVTASIEERVPRHILTNGIDNHGWLTAEYGMLPGATNSRNQRDRLKISGRTTEIQRLIGRSLRACLDLSKLGQRTITIDADVLQADGGTRVAAITGAYVAMADAVQYLMDKGSLSKSPVLFSVAAVSVGVVGETVVLDLNYEEDSQAAVDANVVMTSVGDYIEVQATSEHAPLTRSNLDEMLGLAEKGLSEIFALQQEALSQTLPGKMTVGV